MTTQTQTQKSLKYYYPLITARERILIWQKVKGMWKNRKPNPILELKKMRGEWKRETIH